MDNFFFDLIQSLWSMLSSILSVLSPLWSGLILAYLLNPLMVFFQKRIKSRGLSILLTYVVVLFAIAFLLYGFLVLILGNLPKGDPQKVFSVVLDYFENAIATVNDFISKYGFASHFQIQESFQSFEKWLQEKISISSVVNTISSLSGGILNFVIGFVASIYILKDKEYFISLWEKLLSLTLNQKHHGIICETLSEVNTVILTFIKGVLVDSLIIGFLSSLVLTVIGVKFAVAIGIIAGILNIIPYFGPFLGMVPAFLISFFSGNPIQGIVSVIGLFLVQQLDCNLIYPKVVGGSIGIHPFFVLLAVTTMGYIGGILGMLLAVPLAGIIQIFVLRWASSK